MIKIQNQAGFTLIEVLISVLVLSVGMLGVAAMQALGVRYTQNSYMLSIATQQAQDMAERMRANPAQMFDETNGYYNSITTTYSGTPPNCNTSTCTALERAQSDHAQWTTSNVALFGNSGSVQRVGETFQVNITWQDINEASAKNFTLSFLP